MKVTYHIKKPKWNEKIALFCKKCGKRFWGVKILLFPRCPHCRCRRAVIEDPMIGY